VFATQDGPQDGRACPSDEAGNVTLLHSLVHGGYQPVLAKRFFVATNGDVGLKSYDNGLWFAAEIRNVRCIDDLYQLLTEIEPDRHVSVIRGAPKDTVSFARLRRRGVNFRDVARHWVMLDVDGHGAFDGVLDDPERVARELLEELTEAAPELRDVTAVVQFSASAGIREIAEAEAAIGLEKPGRWAGRIKPGLSAHVWFWLRKPLGQKALKRWQKRVEKNGFSLDYHPLQTVQHHFTAVPIFDRPLRDPLAGRRTFLIRGLEDDAELVVPDTQWSREAFYSSDGGNCYSGLDFMGCLATIGGAQFRVPMCHAIFAYLREHWPNPDLEMLKAAIRERLVIAPRGSRSEETIAEYASDRHLDGYIGWCLEKRRENEAERQAKANARVEPAFPDKGLPREEAIAKTAAVIDDFVRRVASGEKPKVMVRLTAGGGKSHGVVVRAQDMLEAASEASGKGVPYYHVPRHDLSDELQARTQKTHPGLKVEIWRGLSWQKEGDPDSAMCTDRELSLAAEQAGIGATAACVACPQNGTCPFTRQKKKKADLWIMAHNFAFRALPEALPDAAVVIVDEAFWGAGLSGTDDLHPILLPLSKLRSTTTWFGRANHALLMEFRQRALRAIAAQGSGGLLRSAFANEGFTEANTKEWLDLEWSLKPKVQLKKGMEREEALQLLEGAKAEGFSTLLPMLAEKVRSLMLCDDARSTNAEIVRNVVINHRTGDRGDAVRFRWKEELAEWCRDLPMLILDASTPVELVRQWVPSVELHDIEMRAPEQHVVQVIGREFGRTFFQQNQNNVHKMAGIISMELAGATGAVVVIAQKAVKLLLIAEIERRFGGTLPDRLHFEHHGAITGLDRHRDADTVICIGRPATTLQEGEKLAELVKGAAVTPYIADEDEGSNRWPTRLAGIRMADGSGRAVDQPYHPDPLVEAVRWAVTDGAVLQAIARGRGCSGELTGPCGYCCLPSWRCR
jgi:hypothetical protein